MKFLILFLSFLINISTYNKSAEGEQVIMIINLFRHGARAPNFFIKEIENHFPTNFPGKLTLNGFRQMNNLGRTMRKIYLENYFNKTSLQNFLNQENIKNEFLLISSPYDRAIESGIGYAYGFLPNNDFNIIDLTHNQKNYNSKSAINNHHEYILADYHHPEKAFNFIIENKNRDVLFHSKKCKFPEHIYKEIKQEKNFKFLTSEEKKEVFEFYKSTMNLTFENKTLEEFSDKSARALYTLMRCTNENLKNKIFEIPKLIESSLIKLFGKYLYLVRTNNEDMTKITVSPFFDHMLKFFDYKFFNHDLDNKYIDWWHFKDLNYTKLKLVSFSGHDYNFVGIFKNLLHPNTLADYLNRTDEYHKFVLFPFASTIDFHLIKNNKNGKYYVRIYLNGQEIIEQLRSGVYDQHNKTLELEVKYDKETGIEYKTFRKILESRIFQDYEQCIHTIKNKKKKDKKI